MEEEGPEKASNFERWFVSLIKDGVPQYVLSFAAETPEQMGQRSGAVDVPCEPEAQASDDDTEHSG